MQYKDLNQIQKEKLKPSLSSLRAVQFNKASRNEEQPFRCVVSIYDLSLIVFDVSLTDDKQSC